MCILRRSRIFKTMKQESQPALMSHPAIYRIRVRGHLDSSWSDRLEAMNITEITNQQSGAESILVGRLADQAALSGVLNCLYEMHLPVLSTDCLEEG